MITLNVLTASAATQTNNHPTLFRLASGSRQQNAGIDAKPHTSRRLTTRLIALMNSCRNAEASSS
jgi:hypothetical protein